MDKEVPLALEDAILFDELQAVQQGLEAAELSIATSFTNLHAEFVKKRRDFYRKIYTKYGLDDDHDYHFHTGPDPEMNKILVVDKMPTK
jgi:hypothetical protein